MMLRREYPELLEGEDREIYTHRADLAAAVGAACLAKEKGRRD